MPDAAHKVVEWAKAHPLPAAGVAGVSLALVAAVAMRKKGSTQGQYSIPNMLTPGAVLPGAGDAGGGIGLGNEPAQTMPQWLQDLMNQQTNPAAPKTTTTTAPTASVNPFVTPQPSVFGNILQTEQVTNPLGSAYAEAKTNPYYTPSLSDYASEVGSGIQRTLAYAPGTPSNYFYTVDNTTLGSGNPVPVDQRIPGERYDAYGRVIL